MRQAKPVQVNNFSKGLITEATEFSEQTGTVSDAIDCVFDRTGFATRRKGFDFEPNYVNNLVLVDISNVDSADTEYLWTSVAGDGTISFVVQQHGSTLLFYDVSTSVDISPNRKSFVVDLETLRPTGAALSTAEYPLQYASGRGLLHVVSAVIRPTYFIFDSISDTLGVYPYELQTRDFTGLKDDLALTERYTGTIADLKTNHPAHYYNLINQGWGEVGGAALTAWDTARADMPSNADYVALYRESPTVIFANNRVLAQDPLNTPAAKGHFILTTTNTDRTAALAADGFSLTLTNPQILISQAAGTIIHNGFVVSTPQYSFNGITSVSSAGLISINNATGEYLGKNYTGSPNQIAQAIVYGTTDRGFVDGSNPSVTFTLYASQVAPTSNTDGTSLGTVTFTDTNNESGGRTITSSDLATFWNYVWVTSDVAGSDVYYFAEVEFYSPGSGGGSGVVDNINTFERPKTCCFFAGRLWYAGLDALSLGNTIFFSQIVQTEEQYAKCYQQNDPTNENIFNLLPSDGGTITIPELGSVRKLFAYQNALLIIASNGVWMVTGGSSGGFGGGFQANDYFVKKLSSVGSSSPLSVIDRRGVPVWWAEDGIYTIQYDTNFNSFNVVNITFKTIRTFFLDIPQTNRRYAKGAYDATLDICYWLYNTEENPTSSYTYDSVLVYNGISNAFYPWTIGDSDPDVHGILAVQDAARNNLTRIKYFITYVDPNNGDEAHLYAEHNSETYKDWSIYAALLGVSAKEIDYSSEFITDYHIDTAGMRYFQSNYLWVFVENVTNASCFVQGLYDFTVNPNSGKWSTPQQVAKAYDVNRDLNFKRLKIRGKGRGLQLRFFSESGKPFQIQGYSIQETMNAQP